MGEVAVTIMKLVVRFSIIIALVFSFIVLFNVIFALVSVSVNQSVIGDLMSMTQMWLPFDLDVLFAWLFTAAGLYVGYRLMIFAASFLNSFLR